jgi:hypothetical protein
LDVDTITEAFPNAATLMEHLQRIMGESNARIKRRERTSFDTLLVAACVYDELYAISIGGTEVEATVNVIYSFGRIRVGGVGTSMSQSSLQKAQHFVSVY